uniref:Peptidase_C25 domain-containing protein n=1 Tax=Steinernema glaseri TaxID=37863 RepID=A0A1I7Y8H2_9BILA
MSECLPGFAAFLKIPFRSYVQCRTAEDSPPIVRVSKTSSVFHNNWLMSLAFTTQREAILTSFSSQGEDHDQEFFRYTLIKAKVVGKDVRVVPGVPTAGECGLSGYEGGATAIAMMFEGYELNKCTLISKFSHFEPLGSTEAIYYLADRRDLGAEQCPNVPQANIAKILTDSELGSCGQDDHICHELNHMKEHCDKLAPGQLDCIIPATPKTVKKFKGNMDVTFDELNEMCAQLNGTPVWLQTGRPELSEVKPSGKSSHYWLQDAGCEID